MGYFFIGEEYNQEYSTPAIHFNGSLLLTDLVYLPIWKQQNRKDISTYNYATEKTRIEIRMQSSVSDETL